VDSPDAFGPLRSGQQKRATLASRPCRREVRYAADAMKLTAAPFRVASAATIPASTSLEPPAEHNLPATGTELVLGGDLVRTAG
jgi:hypothetical protein